MRRPTVLLAALLALAAPARGGERSDLELKPVGLITSHLYEGPLREPRGVSFDARRGEVWVADTANDLLAAFGPDSMERFACGRTGAVRQPIRVLADARGRLLVLGDDRSRIAVLNARGELLSDLALPSLGERPVLGTMAMGPDGNLYVGENTSGQVLVYDADLKLRLRFGSRGDGPGEFQAIAGIAADKELVFVVDQQVTAVQAFDRKGDFVRGWGRHDMGVANFSLPSGIALDASGHVVVVDALRHEIKLFDREGNFVDRFGGLGSRLGQVSYPSDVATDPEGRIYVADKGNSRIQVFQVVNPKVPERSPVKERGDQLQNVTQPALTDTRSSPKGEGN